MQWLEMIVFHNHSRDQSLNSRGVRMPTPSTESDNAKRRWSLKPWLQHTVFRRKWLTFVVMGLSFFIFGAGTLNLFFLLQANGAFLLAHGWQAVAEGGLMQLLEIVLTGYASLVAYVLFKACEYQLTHWLHSQDSDSEES
jgi:hypothetical protein